MNLQTIKHTVSRSYGRSGLVLQKYSPEILLGFGLVGGVVAAVMAAKATLNAGQIKRDHDDAIDELSENNYLDKNTRDKATAMVYVQTGLKYTKLYGPSVGLGVLSITAILGSHGIMGRRQTSLIAAYGLLNEGFKAYRQRVVEELGEDVDQNFHLGLKDEEYTETSLDENGKKVKTKKTRSVKLDTTSPSIYARIFDSSNVEYRSDRLLNKAFILSQQNYLNDVLFLRGHVFLNEAYERLGFPHTKEGQLVGWVLKDPKTMKEEERDGYIDFGLNNFYNDPAHDLNNGEGTFPTFLIDPNVDGIVYDLI